MNTVILKQQSREAECDLVVGTCITGWMQHHIVIESYCTDPDT